MSMSFSCLSIALLTNARPSNKALFRSDRKSDGTLPSSSLSRCDRSTVVIRTTRAYPREIGAPLTLLELKRTTS